jgi:ATP-dependent Clp protease ATP-binding subunit ClpC
MKPRRTQNGKASSHVASDARERAEVDALLRAGRWDDARERAEQMVARFAADPAAHSLLSRALFYVGQPTRALVAAERAVELSPEDPALLARAGGLYVAVGRFADALARCRAALAIDPRDLHASVNLALALARTGGVSAAVDALDGLRGQRSIPSSVKEAALGLLSELSEDPRAASLRAEIERASSDEGGVAPAVLATAGRQRSALDSVLERVGRDLTELARRGALDRVTGRDAELEAVLDVLCRRRKSNPCLVGAAGVGKTAIVEGLAQRIAAGEVPSPLRGARIIEVSMASLSAGTSLRGELEARMQRLLEELREDRGTLLFLDEVHTLVGSAGAPGQLGIAEILKPAMARGELSLIGATTDEGYERTILRDPALARRFDRISVSEPDADALRAILRAAATDLGRHHGVVVADADLTAVAALSARWLADRRMPDVGVDLLDRACVRAARRGSATLTPELLLEAVAACASTTVSQLTSPPRALLVTVERALERALIGQRAAVAQLASGLAVAALRAPEARRPRAVLWLVGPPSVGKHSALRALAHATGRPLVTFDLGTLGDRQDLPKLVGSAAGYVGYDDGAPLPRALRAQPNALLCFDSPELAHPDARALLAQALRDAALIDARGDRADLRRAVVVFVSSRVDAERARAGFSTEGARPSDPKLAESTLGASLASTLDATVSFDALSDPELRAICRAMLDESLAQLAREGASVRVDDDAIALVCAGARGARDVRARCERMILSPALRRTSSDGEPCAPCSVSVERGGLVWRPECR